MGNPYLGEPDVVEPHLWIFLNDIKQWQLVPTSSIQGVGGGGTGDANAQFIVAATTGSLPNAFVLTPGPNITINFANNIASITGSVSSGSGSFDVLHLHNGVTTYEQDGWFTVGSIHVDGSNLSTLSKTFEVIGHVSTSSYTGSFRLFNFTTEEQLCLLTTQSETKTLLSTGVLLNTGSCIYEGQISLEPSGSSHFVIAEMFRIT